MKGLTVTIKQVCGKRGGPDAEWSSAEQVLDYDCMFNTTISVTPEYPQRRNNFCSGRSKSLSPPSEVHSGVGIMTGRPATITQADVAGLVRPGAAA